jgi:CMP-N,N'-diacetyllegionaminic acid synthase
MTKSPSVIALIPARAGSKRVPHKNVRPLGGHPLLAYTIAAAQASGIFSAIVVSTEAPAYAAIARHYGAEVPFLRTEAFAEDFSPDIEWVEEMLQQLRNAGREYDCFSLLRPTSPFLTPDTIRAAWQQFLADAGADSLRAIELCRQHPGKMWVVRGARMVPLLPLSPPAQPWHSSPYAALPEVYIQNASLEIAWSRVVFDGRTIAGQSLMPFLTQGYEGFDINSADDWRLAAKLVADGMARLPEVRATPYPAGN